MNSHAFARGTVFLRPRSQGHWLYKIIFLIWRVLDKLKRTYDSYLIWNLFDSRAIVGDKCTISPNAYVQNTGVRENIVLQDVVTCKGILVAEYGGKINIGHHVFIGDNTIISAYDEISIGNNVLISHGVHIFDNDSHPKEAMSRENHFIAILDGTRYQIPKDSMGYDKISIGDNVWIGFNSTIMKGVTIGEGAIIGCGAIVTQDVPPYSLAVGSKAISRPL